MLVPLLSALAIVSAAPDAQATHAFTVRDMLAMDRLSDPQASPDARRVVYVQSRTDLDANRRRADLWLVGLDGSSPRRLTAHPSGSDSSPTWSKDGRSVYFLSSRSGSSQVWRITADGGEAEQVTTVPLDVGAYVLAPDGRRVVVALDVFVDCPDLACTKKRLDDTHAAKATGRLFDQLLVRHWDTWSDGRRSHLFVVPVAGGAPVDLMKGLAADAPTKPFGGSDELAVSPDSTTLVFTAKDGGSSEAWSTNSDLFAVALDGSGQPRRLTTNPAADTQPRFSPDGKTLVWLAQRRPGYESDRFYIMSRPWPAGPDRTLAERWDRSPGSLSFSPDGRELVVTAEDVGEQPVFLVDLAHGEARKLVASGVMKGAVSTGSHVVFTRETLKKPAELWMVRHDGGGLTPLTHANDARVSAMSMGEPTPFSFAGWNDEKVHGWIVKPAGFEPGRRYPVALLIHGGPQGSFNNEFHYRWNPQAYAGAGFAVVTVDFHGSTGYGQAFTDAIQGDWGGKPLEDLKRGLAAAIAQSPYMDGERVCALGASFGGYMINWIAGAWPDRFRCLVAHDGNLDERAAYFATEELWFPERDHEGTPWDNPAGYEKHNPVSLVKQWKTPMLVVHGGQDFRVVDTEGLSTFTVLQRRGIPSKLLYFPDENHWVIKPANTILWHDTVLDWLREWTSEQASKPAARTKP
jgi:dipeptidyl aminopeptidase/acylaminoacyl peptidase